MRTLLRSVAAARNGRSVLVLVALVAIAIGASTVVLSFVDAVLLRPLPYPEADRMVQPGLTSRAQRANGMPGRVPSFALFTAWQEDAVFQLVGAFMTTSPVWAGNGPARRLRAVAASSEMMPLLGGRAALGRMFGKEDDRPGSPPVVLLSSRVWQEAFQGDPGVLGRTMVLDGRAFEVVGVMPQGFRIPTSIGEEEKHVGEIWTSLGSYLDAMIPQQALRPPGWSPGVNVIGLTRLNQGREALEARLTLIAEHRVRGLRQQPQAPSDTLVVASPLRERIVGAIRGPVQAVAGAVLLILLGVCTNAAGVLLARAIHRTPEFALRMALGASKARIATQLIGESMLLAFIAGVAGIVMAIWMVPIVSRIYGPGLPDVGAITINLNVIALTAAVALLAGGLMSLGPLILLQALDPAQPHGAAALRKDSSRQRGIAVVVTAEIVLTLLLMISAAQLIGSLVRASTARGFDAGHAVAAQMLLAPGQALEKERRNALVRAAIDRLTGLPAVDGVAAGSGAPIIGGGTAPVRVLPSVRGEVSPVDVWGVTSNYFHVLGIPVLRGAVPNDFSTGEVLIDQAAAHLLFGDDDPVGRRLAVGSVPDEREVTVMGVVGPVVEYRWGGWSGDAGVRETVPPRLCAALGVGSSIREIDSPGAHARIGDRPCGKC